ncbi:aspartyl/glutamyl-tRNA(Asn/Gln) amidotransferase subunit B [Roseimicrobium gellanilyticum]|uniref:Aspartyl/glutamyl-tRNA(Asn/Gln) amidotransferase subunit B n=1 Tax=Roseimicrobium gellanilyticum TaxID=748857 RepID=A0A366HCZ7_9BACT|nr:Asp-tRNA(Asn)/Glu-tRNA(Gln) amidotransferase subunit GatB [Roseimicrobium gellanilyticum]RBP40331.1 aspartyl/glutamyl-tRNA(Asn/Gln) amidotransferase subunit B [Roseimicrobium gellanilyticum]
MPKYITTIGLEVHAQINTRSKMFCACPAEYGADPNTHTCPTCLGLPGALPVLNLEAIEKTLITGQMLGCSTPEISKWDRKNYFYPDMPKNYQLTQFDLPLCIGGGVPLYEFAYPKDAQKNIKNPGKVVKLTRIHLEEDVGKSTHTGAGTLLDFNRAGTPLMEIVSDPDIDSAEEAFAYLSSLRQILLYGGVSDADMEKGQMRCDVNISLRPEGQKEYGAKIELKNLNSVSAVRRAIHAEIERQTEALDRGEKLIQSTRRWDDDRGETQLMRTKEDAHDYRYFPCPDLLPIRTAPLLAEAKKRVPELPHEKCDRFVKDYAVSAYDANVLASEQSLAAWFEQAVAAAGSKVPAKKIANWVINELLGVLNANGVTLEQSPITPQALSELVSAVETGSISNNQAKEVFAEMFATGKTAAVVIKEKGFEQVSDTGALEKLCDDVIAANPAKVEEFKAGNDKVLNWMTGQIMKASGGKANPKILGELLRAKLG